MTSNSTAQEIEKELLSVCKHFGAFAAPCADFVDKYTPELMALLQQDLNATVVCEKLNKCNATVVTQVEAPKPGECKLCKVRETFE